jgi:hypothetical protein
VERLAAAGLVKITDEIRGPLAPTELIEKVQLALNISLTELSKNTPESIIVNPVFGRADTIKSMPEVFILMPFTEDLQPVYEDHIKKICSGSGLTVARADDFFAAESVISDIWSAIVNCQIVIADCTGRNPNVFYEIGIAHTIGRPTILITQNIEDVPFDLRHIRCIVYSYTPRGMNTFNENLSRTLETEKAKLVRSST